MYIVSPINEENLVDKIMDAATEIKNDPGVIQNPMQSILERDRLCIDVGGDHLNS